VEGEFISQHVYKGGLTECLQKVIVHYIWIGV